MFDDQELEGETVEIEGNKNKSFKFKYLTSENKQEIYILGPIFVKNNKDKCSLIIDDNINCELRDKYKFNKKGEHSVTLIINEENVNFSFLFYIRKDSSEKSLFDNVKDLFKDETYKTDELKQFQINNNLIDVTSLVNLDTSEYTDLSYMFCGCSKINDFNFVKNGMYQNVKISKVCLGVAVLKI